MTPRDETYDFGLAPGERFEPDEDDEEPFDLARPHVMTALGPIDPDDLGFTLLHEHASGERFADGTADPARFLAELEDAYNVGLRAIVDLTPVDDDRAAAVLWIAQRSPVHLILVTGDHGAVSDAAAESIDELAARTVRELTEGIDGTSVRAGLIAAGTSAIRITPAEERVLRAAARAHLATGASIATRAESGETALAQLAIFREEGVDPRRVIVGLRGGAHDEISPRRVVDTGAYLSVDQFGPVGGAADEDRAATVGRLVDDGCADRLLLAGNRARRLDSKAYGGGSGWSYLVEVVPLVLMEAGLDAPTVRRLFVDNPARALTVRR